MIMPGTEIQVLVATKPVDFRNYAERTIMRSARRDVASHRWFLVGITPHISACARSRSAWP